MGGLLDSTTELQFEINGQQHTKEVKVWGSLISKKYFKYSSSETNAAFVVNKVPVYYAVRVAYIHSDGEFHFEKIHECSKLTDVERVISRKIRVLANDPISLPIKFGHGNGLSTTLHLEGEVLSTEYFASYENYGRGRRNVALVVNEAMACTILVVYVDTNRRGRLRRKRFKVNTQSLSSLRWRAQSIKDMLQQCCHGRALMDFPGLDHSADLRHFVLSECKWWTRPLQSAAKEVGGKHSIFEVTFTHGPNIARGNNYASLSFIVERVISGVLLTKQKEKGGEESFEVWADAGTHLRRVNLRDFLMHCNRENRKGYQLGVDDCHYFAAGLWRMCVGSDVSQPNIFTIVAAAPLLFAWTATALVPKALVPKALVPKSGSSSGISSGISSGSSSGSSSVASEHSISRFYPGGAYSDHVLLYRLESL